MVGHQMAPAFGTILTLAQRAFLECRDVFGALRDLYRFWLPKTEAFTGPPDQERKTGNGNIP